MYNGIGLQTARGSGTNGYVQANLSAVLLSRKRVEYNAEDDLKRMEAEINRKPNEELLQHARKRHIEMKCAEFEVLMEEKGFDDDEIEKKVSDYRNLLLGQLESGELNVDDELDIKNSHAKMQFAKKGRDRFRDALGLDKDYVPGSSMEKMNKTDVVGAAMEPVPPVDEKAQMLATLKEMKKKEKEKKKAKKEAAKKKRKRKESSSSSSSSDSDSSDSDSDSGSSDSSSDSSEDEKRHKKSKKSKEAKKPEKEIKKEVEEESRSRRNEGGRKDRDEERRRSPDRRRRDVDEDRRDKKRERSPRREDRERRRRSPNRRDEERRRGHDSRSRSPQRRRHDSRSPERTSKNVPDKKIKEEPMSEEERSPPRSPASDSDSGRERRTVRSTVTRK